MNRRQAISLLPALALPARPQDPKLKDPPPPPQPVPRMQVIPLPECRASFQRDGDEIAGAWFHPQLRRPFLFPVNGPSGRSLTRMGHPRDPDGHSHHNSVWISHHDVNGISFWNDVSQPSGRIVHQAMLRYEDGPEEASALTRNAWTGPGGEVVLSEHRLVTVRLLPEREFWLLLDLQLEAPNAPAVFGKTPFGINGVRLAKTISVYDGGGAIRNSEGGLDEPQVFWKRARWVDYSGPMTPLAVEGITLMDHPSNPNHPSFFHVRRDGWMGCSLTFDAPRTVEKGRPLRLRYGLYIHSGQPAAEALDARWREFAKLPLPELPRAAGR